MTDTPLPDYDPHDDRQYVATVDLLRRTGLRKFSLRWQDDEDPVAWLVVGTWPAPDVDGLGATPDRHEVGAAFHPLAALLNLAEKVIDGGTCRHCSMPTIFDHRLRVGAGDVLDLMGCVYRYDPELDTYRRSCEGRTPPPPPAGPNRAERRRRK